MLEIVCMNDFFNKDEIVFYKNVSDLSDKINFYAKKDILRKKIAKKVKKIFFPSIQNIIIFTKKNIKKRT